MLSTYLHLYLHLWFCLKVNLAIQEAFQSTDPLDDPNFDTVKHINSLFPNEQSLANLDPFVAKLKVPHLLLHLLTPVLSAFGVDGGVL